MFKKLLFIMIIKLYKLIIIITALLIFLYNFIKFYRIQFVGIIVVVQHKIIYI